jgi:glutathione S-transferase
MPATQTADIKPITLHALDFWGAPNPRKIAIALELLHIPYEVKLWQFGTADNGLAGPIFSQTINAAERVPVIHDPNTGIDAFESAAIINYLTRTYDKESKLSVGEEDSEEERVDAEAWTHFLVSGLGAQTSNLHFFKKQGRRAHRGRRGLRSL